MLEAASEATKNLEKQPFRSSNLNSSSINPDLEQFFKTAPKMEVVDEDAFEDFWNEEKTVELTKMQSVLSTEPSVSKEHGKTHVPKRTERERERERCIFQ